MACFPHMNLSRRTLLAAAAAGTAGTAGCLDGAFGGTSGEESPTDDEASPTPTDRELPAGCPTTQDLDIEWPTELTDGSIERFVEAYENAYYREAVVEYEPATVVDEYGLAASVSDGPVAVDGGYRVVLSGSGGVYEPGLHLRAERADPPADADVAAEGEAETRVRRPRERVDELIEQVASLSADASPLEGPGDSTTAYFEVNDATVELAVQADNFHGDYWWKARYYVDEHVVRRLEDEEGDPRDGELLECRKQS
ncbi:hypothetical protein BRD07_04705 [Halobacteriales archaeon QS_9_68_42]|nr:MAG: hypothetical protein BRD07_04705 [Halobacteriales archaeon QS_9_68_42]